MPPTPLRTPISSPPHAPRSCSGNPAAHDTVRTLERSRLLARIPLASTAPRRLPWCERFPRAEAALSSEHGCRTLPAAIRTTCSRRSASSSTPVSCCALDAQGAWKTRYDDETSDYAELPAPRTVAATVMERVERLGPVARRVAGTAALTSAGFTLAQVQPATALSEWGGARRAGARRPGRAARAIRRGLPLRPRSRTRGDRGAVGKERRRLIHDRLAAGLIAQQARADLIAMHLQEAERPTEAMAWRVSAGRDAERLFAWGDRARAVRAGAGTRRVRPRNRYASDDRGPRCCARCTTWQRCRPSWRPSPHWRPKPSDAALALEAHRQPHRADSQAAPISRSDRAIPAGLRCLRALAEGSSRACASASSSTARSLSSRVANIPRRSPWTLGTSWRRPTPSRRLSSAPASRHGQLPHELRGGRDGQGASPALGRVLRRGRGRRSRDCAR